jgi:putative tryptophan/tyrosine transport system substrate-binding protein
MQRRQLVFGLGLGFGAWIVPWASLAQPAAGPARIGWVSVADSGMRVEEFRGGLRELGYVGPRELLIDVRIAQRDAPSVRAAVDELLQLPVALIVAHINAAPLVQRAVAGRAPIVFAFSGDPVEAGLVASYARPGGNTTGMSFMALELVGKRLELIKDMAPRSKRVAILFNPMHPGEKAERQASLSAAEQLGLEVLFTEFDPAQGFEAALDKIRKRRCDALVVFPDAGMLARAAQIAEFGLKERLMCVSGWAEFSHAGCIASYGPNLREGYRRLAHYADRILRGAHPSSLPVELPTRVEMVLNLKTAKAMGITIPQSLLLRADEVIQ